MQICLIVYDVLLSSDIKGLIQYSFTSLSRGNKRDRLRAKTWRTCGALLSCLLTNVHETLIYKNKQEK